jgi:hypothetical protein
MKIERFIFIAIAVISISSMIYIPEERIRKALLSFMAFQSTTWLVSILLVQSGKASYPVREFVKATSVNFIPQFIFYPTIFMWFILLFPKDRSILIKIMHYIIFVSIMQWFIYFTYKYTDIYSFPVKNDYLLVARGYLRNLIQFVICHLYITWFFRNEKSHRGV